MLFKIGIYLQNFLHGALIISACLATTTAVTLPSATATCQLLSSLRIETLTLEANGLDASWIDAQSHYWSAANADLYPACVVIPKSVEEVARIVSILQNKTDVPFAVKSGGHNPNVGFSSVNGGVLISMSNLSSTVLSHDQRMVDIGPGARWGEVVKALDGTGVTVVSGRLGAYPILKAQNL